MISDRSKKIYCRKHDYHYRKYGDPLYYKHEAQGLCNVDGCVNRALSKHLCPMHYMRDARHNDVGPSYTWHIGIKKNFLPEYYSYNAMKIRCTYSGHKQYKDYGGRGIKVCDRWLGPYGFLNFLEDMGKRPEGYTLDRIDNNGDYCPENCRWADRVTQSSNRRPRVLIKYHGKRYTISRLAEKNNLPPYVLYNRIMKYNWTIDKAVTTPIRNIKRS